MFRAQTSLPEKSNAFRTPVPVITQTFFPSVTGDGDDIFCFICLRSPSPRSFFQATAGPRRSTHHRYRLPRSATFRKMWSPQTIGVAPLQAGRATFQAIFSVADHFSGRPVSVLVEL